MTDSHRHGHEAGDDHSAVDTGAHALIAADRGHEGGAGHSHAGGDGHSHGVNPDADKRFLSGALALIVAFMIAEVIVGIIAGSLALISDAGHMLTDAASIVLALWAINLAARPAYGRWTYGFKRAEILSAQANGLTLLLLAAWFVYEAIRRLFEPPEVQGLLVFITRDGRNRGEHCRGVADQQGEPDQLERRGRVPAHPQRPLRVHRHRDRRPGRGVHRFRPRRLHRRAGGGRADDQGRVRAGA